MYRRNWQIVVGVVKKSLKRYNQIKNDPSPSALEERFTSLLESSIDSSNFSSIKNNPDLAKILKKYSENSEATFKSKYQSEISYLKLENLLARNKHAREIADTITTPAWSGRESVEDSNLRMIIDTAPKRMPHQKRIFTPPVPMRDRIHNAKEGSLDYKLSKLGEDEEKKESENFKELYKERLLGPLMFNAMSPTSSVGLAGTMADVRINEQIDKSTGQFKDHPNMNGVRGKPLRKEHLANCTDTNYFMNQILQKQECLPPWIESQKGVNGDIERLRFDLDKTWSLKVVEMLKALYPNKSKEQMIELVRAKYQTKERTLFDSDYDALKMRYLRASVKEINMRITTYNLSSPSSDFHKWKLVPERELQNLYERVLKNLDKFIESQRDSDKRPKKQLVKQQLELASFRSLGFLQAVKSLVKSF